MSGRRAARAESSELSEIDSNGDAVEAKPEKRRGIFYYIGVGLSAGLFAFVLLLGVLVIVVPLATGSTPMTVLTNSMEPSYPPGTLIIVRPIEPADIRIGDAITYQIESGKPAVVTHRVISIGQSGNGDLSFITQGDNNGAPDEAAVRPVQIKGKVWYSIPWIGYLNNLVNGENRVWIVPTIAIGLFLYAGYMLASGLATWVRKRRAATGSDGESSV